MSYILTDVPQFAPAGVLACQEEQMAAEQANQSQFTPTGVPFCGGTPPEDMIFLYLRPAPPLVRGPRRSENR